MQVQVTGKHIEITPGLRSFVSNKMAKLEDIYSRVKKVSVVLVVEKYRHTAEIHFHAEGVEMSAKKTTKDMYASIDQCLDALEQQASKRKDKLHTQGALRRAGQRTEKSAAKAAGRRSKSSLAEAPESLKPRVSRVKNPATKPMSLDDAVMMLSSKQGGFVLYQDALSGNTHLLFIRDDGTLGLMEA